jgi:hypothetical protein
MFFRLLLAFRSKSIRPILLSLLASLLSSLLNAQVTSIVASGSFCTQQAGWLSIPVGSSGMWNPATYSGGTFTVSGAGSQINGTTDSFGFAYESLSGDGTITARVVNIQGGTLAGVMIRETLNAGSTNATAANYGSIGTSYFDIRATTGGSTTQVGSVSSNLPVWVKLVRSGNTFSGYSAPDGINWTQIGITQTVNMAQNVFAGLAVTGGSSSSPATATFDHVSTTATITPLPCLASLSATTGNTGSQLMISGSGFGASQGSSSVLLNGTPVIVNFWSNTTISVTIPNGATTGSLWVHEPTASSAANDSNSVMFTVTSEPMIWGWMDYDLGSETFGVGTGGSGGSGGSGQLQVVPGSATYASGTFTVNGSGLTLYSNADSSHFAYQQLSGDGSIVARLVNFQGIGLVGGSGRDDSGNTR